MSQPTFRLPPCPACSVPVAKVLTSPTWHFAHNTSRRRERNCYIWGGCPHAEAIADRTIRDGAAEWAKVEALWFAEARRLFALRTERWTEVERAKFKRGLEDKFFLPGTTQTFDFSAGPASSTETQEPTKNHGNEK